MNSSTRALARLERSLWFRAELTRVLLLSRIGGIHWAVRYLRNPHPRVTEHLLRRFNAQIGTATTLKRSLCLDNVYEDEASAGDLSHLRLGRNCYIGDGVYFDLANRITIGANAVVAGHASFLTHSDCNRSKRLAELFPRRCTPVEICDDVWIGFGATILGGVTVGAQSVVAAGAVVTESLAGGGLYAGAPASLVRMLDLDEKGPPSSEEKAFGLRKT